MRTMRDWNLRPGDPLSLTWLADFRLSKPDYVNDQIWELEIGAGEPRAGSPHHVWITRTRHAPFLPLWGTRQNNLHPAEFSSSPYLRRFYPNFLWFEFSPFEGWKSLPSIGFPNLMRWPAGLRLNNRTTFCAQNHR